MVVAIGAENGGWIDFYTFNQNGHWFSFFVVLMAAIFGICMLVRLTFNSNKRMLRLQMSY